MKNIPLNQLVKVKNTYLFRLVDGKRYVDITFSKFELENNKVSEETMRYFAAKLELLALQLKVLWGRRYSEWENR